MSKDNDPNLKSFSELKSFCLPNVADQIEDTEVLSQLNNIPISSIKEMMNLPSKESNYYAYINNNQQKITENYLTNCNLFSNCNTIDNQILFFIDLLKKTNGTIINSKILKQFIESMSNDQIPQLTLRDYQRLLMLNCCKENINLNNNNDYILFINLLSNLLN